LIQCGLGYSKHAGVGRKKTAHVISENRSQTEQKKQGGEKATSKIKKTLSPLRNSKVVETQGYVKKREARSSVQKGQEEWLINRQRGVS